MYILILLLLIAGFNGRWEKPYPTYNIYEGNTEFSGQRAYKDLEELIEAYPNRHFGSYNVKKAGQWVKDKFEELGLAAEAQVFEGLALKDMVNMPQNRSREMLRNMPKVEGINILGVSPGKSKEAILIGAHRDTIFSLQGAEDDGSGTAAMLELARVLAKGEHKYTYIFASFDGEEMGLYGSEYFAAHNGYPIKLAVCLDMVGYKNANSIMYYENISSKGISPVWVKALSRQILTEEGRKDYMSAVSKNNQSILSTYMIKRTKGSVSTDTKAFVDRSIAALGIKAADDTEADSSKRFAAIHSNEDIIEQVSPKVLEFTGSYVEKFVRSLELNSIIEGNYSKNYIPLPEGYIPGYVINITIALLFLLLSVPLGLYYKDMKVGGIDIKASFKREARVIGLSTTLCLIPSLILYLLVRNPGWSADMKVMAMGAWFLLNIPVTVLLVLYRKRQLVVDGTDESRGSPAQRFVLNLFLFIWLLAGTIIINPFAAFGIGGIMILIFARASFKSRESRILWRVLFIAYYIPYGYSAAGSIIPYITSGFGFRDFFTPFWTMALWVISSVYIIGSPAAAKKEPASHTDAA